MKYSPEHQAWLGMQSRCYDPRADSYEAYAGRGITVYSDWRGEGGFERFFAHIGLRPGDGYSIERIDNDGNYEPGNVKWATIYRAKPQ